MTWEGLREQTRCFETQSKGTRWLATKKICKLRAANVVGHKAVVELRLATCQVRLDLINTDLPTPLSYAAENGHEAVVKLLLTIDRTKVHTGVWDNDKGLTSATQACGMTEISRPRSRFLQQPRLR
jgi:hypothetical protein